MTKSPFDTKYAYTIICPYCGFKYPDPGEESPGEEDIGELVCSHCEQDFYATRNVSITYSTEMIGE
jgi:transposase